MSDQAEPSVLEPGLLGRIGQAVMRPLREVGARLLAALWLIVAVGVIMASLVLVAGLSKAFALIGLVSFVVSAMLLPRHDTDKELTHSLEPASDSKPAVAANRVL